MRIAVHLFTVNHFVSLFFFSINSNYMTKEFQVFSGIYSTSFSFFLSPGYEVPSLQMERGYLINRIVCSYGLHINGMGQLPEWVRGRGREL